MAYRLIATPGLSGEAARRLDPELLASLRAVQAERGAADGGARRADVAHSDGDGDDVVAHRRLQLLGGALGDDDAAVDDREPVAELVGLVEVLRREEDGRAGVVDPAYLVPDCEA